jgi:hypothetical protein
MGAIPSLVRLQAQAIWGMSVNAFAGPISAFFNAGVKLVASYRRHRDFGRRVTRHGATTEGIPRIA